MGGTDTSFPISNFDDLTKVTLESDMYTSNIGDKMMYVMSVHYLRSLQSYFAMRESF